MGMNAIQNEFKLKVYPQFNGKTMRQLQSMAGAHRTSYKRNDVHAVQDESAGMPAVSDLSLLEVDEGASGMSSAGHAHKENYVLPRSWDWRDVDGKNFMEPVIDQGECGSCYAVAVADMITARVAVQTNNSVRIPLSAQEILGCGAKYQQGCDGGFPFLASKYVADFGIASEVCYPYEERGFSAPTHYPGCGLPRHTAANPKACKYRVKVSKYDYIGGCYGCCSEKAMMQEIYENGPIVSAFKVNPRLLHYAEGVFLEIGEGVPTVNRWEETDHAVVVVGWGETVSGKKYWIVKNSWGAEWGNDGYFQVQRGTDVMAFESMAVAALPIVSNAMHVHSKILPVQKIVV